MQAAPCVLSMVATHPDDEEVQLVHARSLIAVAVRNKVLLGGSGVGAQGVQPESKASLPPGTLGSWQKA